MNTKQVHVVVFLVIGICGPLWGMSMPIDIGDSLPAGAIVNTWPDYVVTAGGADIWGTADQFTYCYHKGPENLDFWTGDFTAIVGVKSMEPSDTSDWWAKAGIMARETLDAGSRHTMIVRSLKNGASMQYRDYTDSSSGSASLQGQYGPEDMVWLRLDRKGDAFIGSYAVGGSTVPTEWRAAAYHILPMPDDVYVGLATTSHQQDTAVTVEYISFQVGQLNPNLAILEPELCDIGGIEMGSMRIREVIDKGNIWGQGACFESLASGGGTIVDYTAPVLDIWDRDGSGHYWGGDHFGVVTAGHRTLGSVDHASMLVVFNTFS